MRNSLLILGCFAAGIAFARTGWMPAALSGGLSLYALWLLILLVGISVGSDGEWRTLLKQQPKALFLLPVGTVLGTLAGAAAVGLLLEGRSVGECLAVGSGMGYYSLSSVLIGQSRGAELGTVALLSNLIREMTALLLAPLLVKGFGPLAPIASGGATSMDTTLPVITRCAGKEYAVLSVFHGFCVDFSVPFLVAFFLSFA